VKANLKNLVVASWGLAALGWTAPAAQAGPVYTGSATMDQLLAPGAEFVNGDKVFSDFSYAMTGDMPTANHVNVVAITVNGNLGLEFQGAFTDLIGGSGSDALIKYVVTSTGGAITDAHIQGDPTIQPPGARGMLTVVDSFLPDAPNQMAISDINGMITNSDATVFAHPYQSLHVQKDIIADAGSVERAGVPSLSFVDQTYSQTSTRRTPVPEPSTLVLGGLGALIGLGCAARRRHTMATRMIIFAAPLK
jgi:hypothetical protein